MPEKKMSALKMPREFRSGHEKISHLDLFE
jgi:hypothetical protein